MREDSERRSRKKGFLIWGLSLVFLATGGVVVRLTAHEPKTETQVLGASVKATPAPTITSGPSGPTSSTSATFKYTDSEKGVTFQCALDGAPLAPCPSTGMTYSGLSETSHTFRVAAQGVTLSSPVSRSWTVDLHAPAPSLGERPENPTIETTARFGFTDSETVTFECRLDAGKAEACVSPLNYKKVAAGDHTFSLVAIDAAGNRSPATTWVWTVLINKAFGISGNAEGLLYPGTAPTPLNLTFTNPYNFSISVLSVTVTAHSSSSNTCGIGGNLDQSQVFELAAPVVVSANSSVTPTSAQRPGNWPTIAMKDAGNQDACQNATFTLSYTGTAQKS
jgi:large repetitive protein